MSQPLRKVGTVNQELKQIIECTQPWYVRLKQDNGRIQYSRVVLWGYFEEGEDGERFTYASPMIVMDGMPTEVTSFKNFDGTEYCPNFTEEILECDK